MKIAFITDAIYPFNLGGSEIRNNEIAKRLVKKGHNVHIYGIKSWKGGDIIKIDGVTIHGISTRKIYNKKGKRNVTDFLILTLKNFLELLNEKYDIIDVASFNYFQCYSMRLVSLIKKNSLIFTWHQYLGDYLIGYFGKIKGICGMILEFMSTKLSKNNIAVSNFVKSELINKKVKEKNIKVVYNGADIKLINKIKIKRKEFDLIFVGRINYQKNLKLLVEAINLLKKEMLNVKICIVGEGEERKNLSALIQKYGLEKNFYFTGAVKDKKRVFEFMKKSKIFVLPSLLEGFPLTIVEANACGLPIISTKTKHNNTSEYIKQNENGVLVAPSTKEFADAICSLLKNDKLRKKISVAGIEKAKSLDWDKITNEQEKYYLDVLKND
ncbi:MAG: glycosyltransferase family 4 protein [Candidatus Pacearchaeota archaeon]|nr:glycosyltransferase family 4 protein [Candidatus Pacearchaeota archaeon]